MDYRIGKPPGELYESLKAMPKIELHRHLEGSLRLQTMAEIAREYKFDLPGYDIHEFRSLVQMTPADEPSADVFISKFELLRHFYRSPAIIERVAYEVVADAAAEGIIYFELRFTPIALAREMNFPFPDVFKWVIGAVKRAERDFGIDVRLIVSMNRHESVELGDQFVDLAIQHMPDGVVAVDLAGLENRYSGAPFAAVFKKARDAGLGVTIHAGEWDGPASVWEAIEILGATRLGHGVRIVENSDIMQMARERLVAFEVCVTSNIQSGVVPVLAQHPLRDLYRSGMLTTINTDDPSVEGINLTDEYVTAIEDLKFTLDDLKHHIMNAARVAFLPAAEREALIKRLQAEFHPATQITPASRSS